MISDSKRREVAARIRELMSECPTIPFFMVIAQAINECLPEEGRAYALIVADLIDRPTCRDVGESYHVIDFVCSECGCEFDVNDREGEPTMWNGGTPTVPKYCPNCGAEVVRDVD